MLHVNIPQYFIVPMFTSDAPSKDPNFSQAHVPTSSCVHTHLKYTGSSTLFYMRAHVCAAVIPNLLTQTLVSRHTPKLPSPYPKAAVYDSR